MFEKVKKAEKKKIFIGLATIGGVVLLGAAYRQGMIKGLKKGAYLGGFYLGREIGLACKNGDLPPGTDQKILEILKIKAKGNI